jgi:hypothetical protein
MQAFIISNTKNMQPNIVTTRMRGMENENERHPAITRPFLFGPPDGFFQPLLNLGTRQ